jgi:hypothetical protein
VEDQVREYVMKPGVTTRVVTLRTGERVAFSPEAVADAAEQIN